MNAAVEYIEDENGCAEKGKGGEESELREGKLGRSEWLVMEKFMKVISKSGVY